ncbi:FecR family protein [Hymenobacter volaticus]|uniref:FecR domain-containing protein n=1 Tax=Hymenobacter volaticus TaxID=2932254 RepID=A0ABY4GFN0_9BACT|nr:FecR domain-containing protein [Hymenobacter volaticus]UOQ69626.1 FecR domain-containing protein [Hymenobacter volaticus]
MTEVEFEDMLQRYLDGTSRPGERELIEQWSNQLGAPENLTLPRGEHDQVRAAMWRQIEHLTQEDNKSLADSSRVLRHPASFFQTPVVRWAAMVLLLVGVALAVLLPRKWQSATSATMAATNWVQHHNAGNQVQVFTLVDSSRITLYPGSSIQYKASLAGPRREVKLNGEAFFQVAKNPTRPFLVYTDQLVTTVLGTSFRVRAYVGRTNEVAVHEGRVSVQLRRGAQLSATPVQPAAKGVVLLPNQRVAYSALAPRPLRKKLVSNPIVLAPQAFTFEKQPVSKVLESLEKAYGVDILYDRDKLADCTITVTFYQESLYEKLDMLSQALGASYSPADNAQIQFHSNGCAP